VNFTRKGFKNDFVFLIPVSADVHKNFINYLNMVVD